LISEFEQLKIAFEGYEKRKWINIGKEVGISLAGCKKTINF